MKKIRCRLSELLGEKWMSVEELSQKAEIPLERVNQYYGDTLTVVDLEEAGRILEAVGSGSLDDLFEVLRDAREPVSSVLTGDDEWHSHCPASADGRHDWYRDAEASNAIYQEYECKACGLRIHEIW